MKTGSSRKRTLKRGSDFSDVLDMKFTKMNNKSQLINPQYHAN